MHLHSNFSDGTDAPARVVERAAELGISALALTDHDTVGGVLEAREAARLAGIAFLSGVEITAHFQGFEVHTLGLGIDVHNDALVASLDRLREGRTARAMRIVDKLRGLGIPITFDRVAERAAGEASIGRIHIARELNAMGLCKTVQGAFEKYIGEGRKAYEANPRMPLEKAIELIHDSGGLAFLAHPGIGPVRRRVARLLELPFDGLEAYHSKHSPGQTDEYSRLAEAKGLLVGGGSDCHGATGRKPDMGKVRVPYARFEALNERLS
ncbi:MAG: PHP domain-containing protein [Candidatus Hydrogenedentes bacterium]|nr:PHP domain-containing protein [Candidatus Hydrogenedentota bacterium]